MRVVRKRERPDYKNAERRYDAFGEFRLSRSTTRDEESLVVYSEQEMHEIGRDPVRLRAYFWRVAMNAKRTARRYRAASRAVGVEHPVTNYRRAFDEGQEDMRWADTLDRFSAAILDNLDAFVETTLER